MSNAPILLYTGQIDWKKNLRCTVEAAALLFRRGVPFQLLLAGQGQDLKAVKALAEEFGISQVTHFLGHVSDPTLLNGLYAAAELFVFPSLYDTAGLVVREAAVMGTPSIVLRASAPAECIQPGVNGLLCRELGGKLGRRDRGILIQCRFTALLWRCRPRDHPRSLETVIDRVEARYEPLQTVTGYASSASAAPSARS